MRKYEWVLFDADHTLFDFDKASEEALAEVLGEHGVDWREGMYGEYKHINVQCWKEHEQGTMSRDTLVYERFRGYFDYMELDLDPVSTQSKYLQTLGRKPYLIHGAEQILEWLKDKARLGYITNGMTEVQRVRLEMIGWHHRFEVIVIAGEIGHSKPQHGYFQHVYDRMGHPDKRKVIVVGDSITADIEGAISFGFDACWFNPQTETCPLARGPEYIIQDLHELRDIV